MTYEDPITLHPATLREWFGACSAAHEALGELYQSLRIPERQEIPLIERLGRAVDDMEATLRVHEAHTPMLVPRPGNLT